MRRGHIVTLLFLAVICVASLNPARVAAQGAPQPAVSKIQDLSLGQFIVLPDDQLIDVNGERLAKKAFVTRVQQHLRELQAKKPATSTMGENKPRAKTRTMGDTCRQLELDCINPKLSDEASGVSCEAFINLCANYKDYVITK